MPLNETPLHLERLKTPTGIMRVVTGDTGVLRAADWETHIARMDQLLFKHYGATMTLSDWTGPPSKVVQALEAYFAGDLRAIDNLETATAGTQFKRQVWAALRSVPAGETLSHLGLAVRMGRDRAVRAVGAANGANPVAIVVPCHRVLGSGGALTGHGGGINRETWLLAHEREHSAAEARSAKVERRSTQ